MHVFILFSYYHFGVFFFAGTENVKQYLVTVIVMMTLENSPQFFARAYYHLSLANKILVKHIY